MKMRSMDGVVVGLLGWGRIAIGLALLSVVASARAGHAWNLRGPDRLGIDLYGSYIDPKGELVLVGSRGAVLHLKGPSDWSMDQLNPDQNYSGAAEGNGVSVRVGNDHFQSGRGQSRGWSSRDGVRWTPIATNISSSLPRLAFGNGHFVLGNEFAKDGEQGVFLVSEDGIHWTPSDAFPSSYKTARTLSFDGAHFHCLGSNDHIMQSDDGKTWVNLSTNAVPHPVAADSRSGSPSLLASFGDTWVQVVHMRGILWSRDAGLQWHPASLPDGVRLQAVFTDGKMLIAVGDEGTILSSKDGQVWNQEFSSEQTMLYGVVHLPALQLWVAYGGSGTLLTSPDGHHWASLSSSGPSLWQVAGGAPGFVAVGFKTMAYSSDGSDWEFTHGKTWSSVVYGKGRFLATGDDGLHVSSDGRNWAAVNLGLGKPDPGGHLAFDGNEFFFLSPRSFSYTAYRSANGIDWAEVFIVSPWVVSDMIPFRGSLVVLDNYLQQVFLDGRRIFDTPWGYEPFVAAIARFSRLLFITEDGRTGYDSPPEWGARDSEFFFCGDPNLFKAITVGNDLFFPGGRSSRLSDRYFPPQLWYLRDGSSYVLDVLPSISRMIYGVASDGKGSLVAVGEGAILHHREEDSFFETPRLVFRREENDLFLSFYEQSLCGYYLQFSNDLRDWRAFTSNEGVFNPVLGPDSALEEWRIPLHGSARFYRLHLDEY